MTDPTWEDYYRILDEMRIAMWRGDFARGQRAKPHPNDAPDRIGTFAHGMRERPGLQIQHTYVGPPWDHT